MREEGYSAEIQSKIIVSSYVSQWKRSKEELSQCSLGCMQLIAITRKLLSLLHHSLFTLPWRIIMDPKSPIHAYNGHSRYSRYDCKANKDALLANSLR